MPQREAPGFELPSAHDWHAMEASEVASRFGVDPTSGLSASEAKARHAKVGANALPVVEPRSMAAVFVDQLKSPLIYLLFGAAGVALAFGHTSDAAVIFTVVLLNSIIGALQEGRAERSIGALSQLTAQSVRVVRDGQHSVVDVREVVPGDVVVLEAGDAVPADARLFEAAALTASEGALTGESVPVSKVSEAIAADVALADRKNVVYAGTHVASGRGRAMVTSTGLGTEVGRIAQLTDSAVERRTPLERRIARFGRQLIVVAAALFVVVVAIGLAHGLALEEIVTVSISQVVGMVPEGLPVAVTIGLSVGVQRMAKRRVLVRKLAAVETLGSTTIICTDKTGTLTRNEMTVTVVHLADGRVIDVSGAGYAPEGELSREGVRIDAGADAALSELFEALVVCNDADLLGPEDDGGRWRPLGDPTEVALLTLAMKGGLVPGQVRGDRPRRAELPFDAAKKMMATQHAVGEERLVVLKGAPEAVLELCAKRRTPTGVEPLDADSRAAVGAVAAAMAARALRVLAVASVPGGTIDGTVGFEGFVGEATLLGLIGQLDPPREEVREAVARCRHAGVRPVMVTGDHKATGYAIARELGIARPGDVALDGRELERLTDEELVAVLDEVSVFARVHPAQKLRIVQAYQRRGDVVAMTGDGVNDAPALVKADVGVAMGITGTEVAKEAAKIVIGDDDFASIVAAIEEGRIAYRNLKKVILYLVSTSIAEVAVLVAALALGYPPPLAAVQILWINLVTETMVTVNLVMDPAEGNEMKRAPTPPHEALITPATLRRLLVLTPAIFASSLGWFVYRLGQGVPFASVQTETFTVLAICQWFNALNCRSELKSALEGGIFRNPWLLGGLLLGNVLQFTVVYFTPLAHVFHTVPIAFREVVLLGVVGSLVLWVEELRKLLARARFRRLRAAE